MNHHALHSAMIQAADQAIETNGHIDKAGAGRIVDVMINGRGTSVYPTLLHINENYKITDEAKAVLDASNTTKFSLLPKNPYRNMNALAQGQLAVENIGDTIYTVHRGSGSTTDVYLNTFKFMLDDPITDTLIPNIGTKAGLTTQLVDNKLFVMLTGEDHNLYAFWLDVETRGIASMNPPQNNNDWHTKKAVNTAAMGNVIYMSWLDFHTDQVCLGYYNVDREEYTFVSKGLNLSSQNTSDFAPSIIVVSVPEKDSNTGNEVLIDKVLMMWVGKGGQEINTILYDPTQSTNGGFESNFTLKSKWGTCNIQSPLTVRKRSNNTVGFAAISNSSTEHWFIGVLTCGAKPNGVYPWKTSIILPVLSEPIQYCTIGNCLYLFYMDSTDNNRLKYIQI